MTGKLVKEMMIAAKVGGPDPSSNARLAAAIEKTRKESVARDVIERATKNGDRFGEEKMSIEHLVSEKKCPAQGSRHWPGNTPPSSPMKTPPTRETLLAGARKITGTTDVHRVWAAVR